ncbi:MAG: diacylglycerol kinase [Deltaproteobacteria bacterium]|nr:MAG: diacylglycerol kinase [Deltaproteobacteria bacterium]
MNKEQIVQKFQAASTRLWRATGFSLKGLQAAFKHEQAFRQEVYVLVLVVPLGLWLGAGALEKVLLIGSWLIVMIAELLNSAVEAVVDRIGSEPHELSGRAKDIASAAVMVALVLAGLTWILLIF